MKIKLFISIVLLFLNTALFGADVTYSNPVLRGDFPDPSVIRVGEDYWATATSSEWGPLFPILHSRDLVNWELKGHIFNKKPAWSDRNYWAPELSHYKGKFYVYYVGRNKADNRLHIAVATADKPEGPWTDHGPMIGQEEGSIDAIIEVDEKGERYMLWKNDGNSRGKPTFIHAQKLSEDGTKLVGEVKLLIRNDAPWEGALIEGPDVVRNGDYFYLFYAGAGCCGKQCSYGTGVARSKSLLGPYEKYASNPIISHNEKWRCPGHGTIVSTQHGRDFFLYHAYDVKDFVWVGRQGVLEEITWNSEGWPVINTGKGTSTSAKSPFGKAQRVELDFSDDFADTTLGVRWQWPHSIDPLYSLQDGKLTLKSGSDRGSELFGSVLAVQTLVGDYSATAFVETQSLKGKAGLTIFGDRQNAIGLLIGDGKVTLVRRQKDKTDTVAEVDAPVLDKTYLRMESKAGHLFRFSVWDGKDWKAVGPEAPIVGDYLPPWDRGLRVALTSGGNENASATFEWLRVISQPAAK